MISFPEMFVLWCSMSSNHESDMKYAQVPLPFLEHLRSERATWRDLVRVVFGLQATKGEAGKRIEMIQSSPSEPVQHQCTWHILWTFFDDFDDFHVIFFGWNPPGSDFPWSTPGPCSTASTCFCGGIWNRSNRYSSWWNNHGDGYHDVGDTDKLEQAVGAREDDKRIEKYSFWKML